MSQVCHRCWVCSPRALLGAPGSLRRTRRGAAARRASVTSCHKGALINNSWSNPDRLSHLGVLHICGYGRIVSSSGNTANHVTAREARPGVWGRVPRREGVWGRRNVPHSRERKRATPRSAARVDAARNWATTPTSGQQGRTPRSEPPRAPGRELIRAPARWPL